MDDFASKLQEKVEAGLPRADARELCFREINQNPGDRGVRLLLAKLFYLDGLNEFAIRELIELRRRSPSESLNALLRSFGALAEVYLPKNETGEESEKTHGEIDFDLSIFDEE